jgi:uncharacterized membrane protein YccC
MSDDQADSPSGIHYALRILAGTTIVWFSLQGLHAEDRLWAVISVIVISEPKFQGAVIAFKSRVLNTVVGCVVALVFLELFGLGSWSILAAMAASVVAGAYLISAHLAWRIAPVTVAIIMIPGMAERSHTLALHAALWRTGATLYGSGIAVGVAWVIAEIAHSYKLRRRRKRANENEAARNMRDA